MDQSTAVLHPCAVHCDPYCLCFQDTAFDEGKITADIINGHLGIQCCPRFLQKEE